jgi:predicted DNA binding CopG/RHH family protein
MPKKTERKALQKAHSEASLHPNLDDVTPIIQFLKNFQKLVDPSAQHPSKLISLKVPVPLLAAFRFKAERAGVPYQTMIKRLMEQWLETY